LKPKTDEIKILITDDHTMFRYTLRKALESRRTLRVVGEASNGDEAVQKCRQTYPDVVLMDLQMPDTDGIQAIRTIRENNPDVGIIALTMHEDDDHLFGAIRAGANGYVLKNSPLQKLLVTINEIASGGSILSSSIATRVLSEFAKLGQEPDKADSKKLTAREIEILQLLARSKTPGEIARKLFISSKTVRNHICNIYSKLDCHDRTQAVLEGSRLGLIRIEH